MEAEITLLKVEGETPPKMIEHTITIISDTTAIVFGGRSGNRTFGDTYSLDTSTWFWSKLLCTTNPCARDCHAACSDLDQEPNQLLMYGGWDSNKHILDDMWAF